MPYLGQKISKPVSTSLSLYEPLLRDSGANLLLFVVDSQGNSGGVPNSFYSVTCGFFHTILYFGISDNRYTSWIN